MKEQKELWIDVPNFGIKYEVSSFGRVRNKITNKILSLHKHRKNGKNKVYLKVDFNINKKHYRAFVHRVVISSFNPCLPFDELEVNHKNMDTLIIDYLT